MDESSISLIDNPITDAQSDLLCLDGYAKAISSFIETCDAPVTIGIQGDWGIGKTSLLNLIQVHLDPRKGRTARTPWIYINTWQHAQFRQEEWLGILVLDTIVSEIENKFPSETAAKARSCLTAR